MADTKNGPELHPQTVELARGANYGSITTMMPGGRAVSPPPPAASPSALDCS
ncbi:MAG TPA: hypothetical protein VGR18_03205 [Rubrobacter sp.]|nr:hypothetical protein [Rubrobacter sp.]